MEIRAAVSGDSEDWERMRQALWPSAPGEHLREIRQYFDGGSSNPLQVLMAFDDTGRAAGFAELSIRSYAEGCSSDRVAYLEGWFVEEMFRRKGIGAALIRGAEQWARGQGCTELASDTQLENTHSAAAHAHVGFEDVERIVCFRKSL